MKKLKTGFARMSKSQRKRIAIMGGKASQKSGKGYRFTTKTAKIAGRKGGKAVQSEIRRLRTLNK